MKKKNWMMMILVSMLLLQGNTYAHKLYLNDVIGKGEFGSKDAAYKDATFRNPYGLAIDKNGNLLFVDSNNNMIKMASKDKVLNVAGKINKIDNYDIPVGQFKDGATKDAMFNKPRNIAITATNSILVADTNNHLIRMISGTKVTTVAGNGKPGYIDGKNSVSSFNMPSGIAVAENGDMFVADTANNVIRKIDTKLQVTTYAGVQSEVGGYADGALLEAKFNEPSYIYIQKGILYIVDTGNQAIRKVENGQVTTIIGHVGYNELDNIYAAHSDVLGPAKYAKLNFPKAMTILADGTIVIADTWNKKIKYVDQNGYVQEFKIGIKNKDGSVTPMSVNGPVDLVSKDNKLYVSDMWDNCIYVFDIEEQVENPAIVSETEQIKISLNGVNLDSEAGKVYVGDGMLMLPVRELFEKWGREVIWLNDTREIVLKDSVGEIKIPADSKTIRILGSKAMIDYDYLKYVLKLDIVFAREYNTVFGY